MDEGKEALLDRLGPGSIINLYGAINRAPVKFKAICQTYVSVFLLEADKLKSILINNIYIYIYRANPEG